MANKLHLNDLDVVSFETSPESAQPLAAAEPIISIATSTDPTAMTWCYICPVRPISDIAY